MPVFQVMSDLHREFTKERNIPASMISEEADAVILAGDITTHSLIRSCMRDISKPVFYVLGNHEYYGADWDTNVEYIKRDLEGTSVRLLENEFVDFQGVRIIGSTLWTDFWIPPGLSGQENQSGNCRRMMSDFDAISGISVWKWADRYDEAVKYLQKILADKSGPNLVITHMAPSFKSSHPKWENSKIKGGFCCILDDMIQQLGPDYWIHGHCHESFRYKIGVTDVICNPYGYHGIEVNEEFNPNLLIRI